MEHPIKLQPGKSYEHVVEHAGLRVTVTIKVPDDVALFESEKQRVFASMLDTMICDVYDAFSLNREGLE